MLSCISADFKHLSKLTEGYALEVNWDVMGMTLEELRFPAPRAVTQGIKAHSWACLQPPLPAVLQHVLSGSHLDLVETLCLNTLSQQGSFRRWLWQIVRNPSKCTVSPLQIAFKFSFEMLQSSASNTSWVPTFQLPHGLKCSKCQIMSFPFQAAEWKECCLMLFPINTITGMILIHGLSHRNPRHCMGCR